MAEAMEIQNINEDKLLQSDVEAFDMKEMEEELLKAKERRERDEVRKDRRDDLGLEEPNGYKLRKEKEEEERAEEERERKKEEKRRRRREREEEEERERKERQRRYREREERERKEKEEREKEQEERRKLFLLQRKQRGNKMSS